MQCAGIRGAQCEEIGRCLCAMVCQRSIPRVYGGWVCWIDFMLHIVEPPSKRPYPDRSGSIRMELSNRLYDSVRKSKSEIRIRDLCQPCRSGSGSWIQMDPRAVLIQGKIWQKGTEVSKCVESVFCASKNRKTKNAQNEILDVRKFGRKVVKTTPGPSSSDSP